MKKCKFYGTGATPLTIDWGCHEKWTIFQGCSKTSIRRSEPRQRVTITFHSTARNDWRCAVFTFLWGTFIFWKCIAFSLVVRSWKEKNTGTDAEMLIKRTVIWCSHFPPSMHTPQPNCSKIFKLQQSNQRYGESLGVKEVQKNAKQKYSTRLIWRTATLKSLKSLTIWRYLTRYLENGS